MENNTKVDISEIIKKVKENFTDEELAKEKRLRQKFIDMFPLDKVKEIPLERYVQGVEDSHDNFSKILEHGFTGEGGFLMKGGGGSAANQGIYFSKEKQGYVMKHVAPNESPEVHYHRFVNQLVDMTNDVLNLKFEGLSKYDLTFGLTMVMTKVITTYDAKNQFFAIGKEKAFDLLYEHLTSEDIPMWNIYEKNYQTKKLLLEKHPNLALEETYIVTRILWEFYEMNSDDAFDEHDEDSAVVIQKNEKDIAFIKDYSKKLLDAKNVIFRGPPGTGKTYLAKEIASCIVSDGTIFDYNQLGDEQKRQIGFVQFHPSFDYTDFVEGIRPSEEGNGVSFELKDGIFKAFCRGVSSDLAAIDIEEFSLEGFERYLKNLDVLMVTVNLYLLRINQLLGKKELKTKKEIMDTNIYVSLDEILEYQNDISDFDKKNNFHYHFISAVNHLADFKKSISVNKATSSKQEKKYVFIIDEINRGEISKIFGELFFSIDPGYRGKLGEVTTQYANMYVDKSEKLYIPNNVYIIGTMNDIDRSVDSFDFAMRRRFRFIEIKPKDRIEMLKKLGEKFDEATHRMNSLNEEISRVPELGSNYQLGASYFLKLETIDFDELWSDYLSPLLEEYIRGMHDEIVILESFKKAYDSVFMIEERKVES